MFTPYISDAATEIATFLFLFIAPSTVAEQEEDYLLHQLQDDYNVYLWLTLVSV